MSNISLLLNTMRKFTPEGQAKIFAALRKNFLGPDDIRQFASSLSGDVFEHGATPRNILSESLYKYASDSMSYIDEKTWRDNINVIEAIIANEQARISASKFSEIYNAKKQELCEFALKDLNDAKLAKQINEHVSTGNLEEDINILNQIYLSKRKSCDETACNVIISRNFRVIQEFYKALQKTSDILLRLFKIIIPESQDPRVRQIEEFLKQKYKLDYIHLENMQEAKKVKASLKIAEQKKLPIPSNIIVTPYPLGDGLVGLNRLGGDLKSTVYISAKTETEYCFDILYQSRAEKSKEWEMLFVDCLLTVLNRFSTHCSEHTIIHEILHSINPLPLCNKKIPARYKDVIANLGGYAGESFNKVNDEVRTELLTKDALVGLNKEEKELLDYLMG